MTKEGKQVHWRGEGQGFSGKPYAVLVAGECRVVQTYSASSNGSAALKDERKDTLTWGDALETSSVHPRTTSARERIESHKPEVSNC